MYFIIKFRIFFNIIFTIIPRTENKKEISKELNQSKFYGSLCKVFQILEPGNFLPVYISLYIRSICITVDVEAFLAISPFGQPLSVTKLIISS